MSDTSGGDTPDGEKRIDQDSAGAPDDAPVEQAATEPPEALDEPIARRRFSLRQAWPALLLALAVAAVIGYVVSQGDGDIGQTAAASYGEAELSLADLSEIVSGSPDSPPAADQATAATITTWLFTLAATDELIARGGEISDAHRADAIIAAQAQGLPDGTVTHEYWSTTQALLGALQDFSAGAAAAEDLDVDLEYLCASHVLVAGEDEARQVKDRADAGEDFGALAAELSTEPAADPDGADSRGDLGCAPAALYIPEFTDGARTAQGSGIVGPVRTDFGWHVIDVRSMGPLSAENHPELSEADVAAAVEQATAEAELQYASAVFEDILDAAADRITAAVAVDERFGYWDDALGGVIPPS